MIEIFGEIHSSKNSRRIFRGKNGQPFVAKSQAAKDDEDMLLGQFSMQRFEWEKMTNGYDYPLRVCFHFRRRTHGRWDFANLVQGVADAMVKAGYLEDDDVSHFIPVYSGYTVDKERPGVDFWIENS